MEDGILSKQALQRLPYYLENLKHLQSEGKVDVSAPILAKVFGSSEIQIRKDLAAVSSVRGRPKTGFKIASLIVDIENVLGYKSSNKAVLVGAGSLGHALMGFKGFLDYGIDIVVAFDANDDKVGTEIDGKPILDMSELSEFCEKEKIQIGIITVPQIAAQRVCDSLVAANIKAIWNFAPIHLVVPGHILVQNENMAANLALLFNHLREVNVSN